MKTLVAVEGQTLRWYGKIPEIADNSVQFVQLEFSLPEDWVDLVVVAQFSQTKTYNKLLENGCCYLPAELVAGPCEVSLFGQKAGDTVRATSVPLRFKISRSGFTSTAETPIPPTPDLYAQLLEKLGHQGPSESVSIEDDGEGNVSFAPGFEGDGEDHELNSLNTGKTVYTSFPDKVAREGLKGKLANPGGLTPGKLLKVKSVDQDGNILLEGMDMPSEGSSVVIDTTLTQPGQAADAKATGDAISKLSGQNPDLTGVVKSVNGIKPDADGNVNISGSDINWMYVTVEVEDEIPCTGISLDKSALTFTGAGQQTIVATVTPANTTDTLTWTSSNPSVATVSNGVVTAYANGSATITATCGEHSATCAVEVSGVSSTVAVTGITLDKATATVQTGFTITLTATVKPDNATNKTVLWSSDDETVATVENGVVTGISEGTASIGAMTADGGFSAVCNVTVAAASNYRNLFDKDTMVVGGGIGYDGIIASNWGMAKVPVKENTVYSLKTTDATADVGYYGAPTAGSIGFADSTGNTLIYNLILGDPSRAEINGINADLKEYAHGDVKGYGGSDGTVEWVTFTTPAGCAYLLFNTTLKNNADKIQLEEGDTIHNYYLPYNGGDA